MLITKPIFPRTKHPSSRSENSLAFPFLLLPLKTLCTLFTAQASSLQFTLKKTNLSLPKASSRAIFTAHPLSKNPENLIFFCTKPYPQPFKSSSRRPLLLCTALSLKKPYPQTTSAPSLHKSSFGLLQNEPNRPELEQSL
uniref:Uncharacterized protein n=1 Tax=Salix viminalis TaxID=40686 RepID=A0A6N2NDQ7_SALVM